MELAQIKENLCIYDLDNGDDTYSQEEKKEIQLELSRNEKDCICDNCFYGRDLLASQLLQTIKERDNLQHELDISKY